MLFICNISKEDLWGKILASLGRNEKKTTFVKLTFFILSFHSRGFTLGFDGSWVHWSWLPSPKIWKLSAEAIFVIRIVEKSGIVAKDRSLLIPPSFRLGTIYVQDPRFQPGQREFREKNNFCSSEGEVCIAPSSCYLAA